MNVLHLWRSIRGSQGGGGGVVMRRLHETLLKLEVNSRVLCEQEPTESETVANIGVETNLDRVLSRFTKRLGLNDIHRVSSFNIPRHSFYRDADILHIHGTHHGYMNYLSLARLTKTKPAVFTLHDMWALTGHCAFSYGCSRWKLGCGSCPSLDIAPPVRRDATATEWKLKKWVFDNSDISFVSPSQWLKDCAEEGMLRGKRIRCIPHGLDLNTFKPQSKQLSREALHIPQDAQVLMFAAVHLQNYQKGGDLLIEALRGIPKSTKKKTILLTMGAHKKNTQLEREVGMRVIGLGYIDDDSEKALAYSAADLFVMPTRAEAFGLVALESITCGTPVVAFAVGGLQDFVLKDRTGYLAKPEDPADLRTGIQFLLDEPQTRAAMGARGVALARDQYDVTHQANAYARLYTELL